ncbi:hypothetical protein D3C83_162990 [compost metagenome]
MLRLEEGLVAFQQPLHERRRRIDAIGRFRTSRRNGLAIGNETIQSIGGHGNALFGRV